MRKYLEPFRIWWFSNVLTYMLQSTEYQSKPYLKWLWRTNDFSTITYRGKLKETRRPRALRALLRLGMVAQLIIGPLCFIYAINSSSTVLLAVGTFLTLSYPVVWAHIIVIPLFFAKVLVADSSAKKLTKNAQEIFAKTKAVKIAIAGSYGKTTVKEMLKTILAEGKIVAATPGNKNVAISHAHFAANLNGNEDVIIVEFGEGKPGDVSSFTETLKPNYGIITGIAPAHLDSYKSVDSAAKDIFSLAEALKPQNVIVNAESSDATRYIKDEYLKYSVDGIDGWKVKNIKVNIDGLNFDIEKGKQHIKAKSKLVGKHMVGPLSASIALASELGLSAKQIEKGVANTAPFEHRLEPKKLAGGSWIIDDTYNGNIEGVKAGLNFLEDVNTSGRKIYVTPGLVEQGSLSKIIHEQIGALITKANPNIVVLMLNSATEHISAGLKAAGYSGEVRIEADPLNFYEQIELFLAKGDVALLQNDWPDAYN